MARRRIIGLGGQPDLSLSGGDTSAQTATASGFLPGASVTFFRNGTSTGVSAVANAQGVASVALSDLAAGDVITARGAVQSRSVAASVAQASATVVHPFFAFGLLNASPR